LHFQHGFRGTVLPLPQRLLERQGKLSVDQFSTLEKRCRKAKIRSVFLVLPHAHDKGRASKTLLRGAQGVVHSGRFQRDRC
jgi:hypothetical protein